MQKHLKTLFPNSSLHNDNAQEQFKFLHYPTIVVKLLHKKIAKLHFPQHTHTKKERNKLPFSDEGEKKSYNLTPDQQPAKTQNATYEKKI